MKVVALTQAVTPLTVTEAGEIRDKEDLLLFLMF